MCIRDSVNAAEMFADATMTELINLADKTIEEITVVTNHDERSVEMCIRDSLTQLEGKMPDLKGFHNQ